MPASRTRSRGRLVALLSLALAFTGLQAFVASPASANLSPAISSFPYTQDWSNAALITANDDWSNSGLNGVQGYLGDDGTTTTAGINPQTLLADSWSTTTDVVANSTTAATNGGVIEVGGDTIAIQGSGTADAPNLVFHLDLTGKSSTVFSFDARDLDGGADDTNQQIAVHYRVGSSGAYTDIPAAYIADATTGGSATQTTHRDVSLPLATDNQADVYVRVMTSNAASNDELVGIDNLNIASGAAGPLAGTNPGTKTGNVGTPITSFTMAATGGTAPYTWSEVGGSLPPGITVTSGGLVQGTPTTANNYSVTLRVTDSAGSPATSDVTFDFNISPPGPLAADNPGSKSGSVGTPITNFTMTATGGTSPYTWTDPTTSLPAGVSVSSAGVVSGTPSATCTCSVTLRVTDNVAAFSEVTFTFTIAAAPGVKTIAELQGTGARSSFAGAGNAQGTEVVTTEGVITGVYKLGWANSGSTKTCGLCGFTIQTGGPDATPGASDGIFVYGFSSFTGLNSTGGTLAPGQSVRVTGKISEFSVGADTGSLTELNLQSGAASILAIADLPAPVVLTTLPSTATDREAHESEIVSPTDVVVTDTYNFETSGELGLATGNKPLQQPGEICPGLLPACITAAQDDIRARAWFTDDASTTAYLTTSNYYNPSASANSDVPLPFMDATHSARVGAKVTFPAGKPGVIGYGAKKWYVYPQRAVVAQTENGAADLGADVITFQDTRALNTAPAAVGGDLKIATYNVENYFNYTLEAFAADNPYYTCQYDNDRQGNHILAFQCTSPQAIPSAFDPLTGAPTAYSSGLVSAPRGAARAADLTRQTNKIVNAINGLGADIVSLEELGNPNKLRKGVTNGPLNPDTSKADLGLGTPIAWRDDTINYLVDALNAQAGAGTWAFVASPEEATDATSVNHMCATVNPDGSVIQPPQTNGTCSWASGQDVIRPGFLYKKAKVVPVGQSDIDFPNSSAPVPSPFDNAREPLAQFFKPVGRPTSDGFAVIVNHFKSKGDSSPAATGGNADNDLTGAFNLARTQQATELVRFANEFADKWNTTKVFLVGDFNAYTGEDPIQAILHPAAGTDDLDFDVVESSDTKDTTYVFTTTVDGVGYGGAGSLDHVLASADARAMISGTDVWEINANETTAYDYGRFNTNATNFFDGSTPFRGSDHNPEIIGINVATSPTRRDIQIIGSNDFHGRLLGSSSDGGAAQLSGAVKSLKATYGNSNSIFVAAGDLIGASTFESFVQKDKPTLEALNAAGLEVSAIGNHEFDQGYQDLINRVMKPYDVSTNPYGAVGGLNWQYIGANVTYQADPDAGGPIQAGDPIVLPTWTKDFGGGISVGFVGAVTSDLPGLVNPDGLAGVNVGPIATAVNGYATQLKSSGVDLVILLVHEGAPSTNCATMNTGGSNFGDLLGAINPDIDAVISGHTHLEYACSFTVPAWAAQPIKKRPVVSAGQYGVALDQLVYSFDTTTGVPQEVTFNNVGVKGPGSTLFNYPEDPTVKAIVDQAVTDAQGPGNLVLGKIAGPFKRARLADTTTENRGGESTLGNLVAEIQRWATPTSAGIAPAQIAFMNPGGLRDDLIGSGGPPADVTYRQAAAVQPFANTLVNMDMTGAQIRAVLEQQWQRDLQDNVPSRPFLRLGTSKGFTYTYYETDDPAHSGAKLGHVTSMYLNGTKIEDATSYSVTMNSFLASGGDNFRAFLNGSDKRDTGLSDLQAQVNYMDANADPTPLAVGFEQHAVRVTFPGGGAPAASYNPGDGVAFTVGSLAMTGVGDTKDTSIKVLLNGTDLGDFAVTNTVGSTPFDDAGTASVNITLPAVLAGGTAKLHLQGNNTGTDVIVPINIATVEPATRDIQILATNDFHGRIANDSGSAAAGAGVMAGAVKQLRTANPDTVFAAAGDLIGASTFESFIDQDKPTIDALNSAGLEVSAAGNHEFDQGYNDLVNRVMAPYNASTNPKGGANWQYIAANIRKNSDNSHALAPSWTKEFGSVKVGFVGAVTEHLPELVSPGGISEINVTDVVTEVNTVADQLKADGADLVIVLVHEGAPGTDCTAMGNLAADTDFGSIIKGVNDNVDAIVSGHTHLAYNCSFPVAGWSARAVKERPVVSAGQYGTNLNKLVFTVDTATGLPTAKAQTLLPLKSCSNSTSCINYPVDGPTQTIVDAAVANGDVLGAVKVGEIGGAFKRGKIADGTTENRGAESTLGNLVAEVQRWATSTPTAGSAVLAFMNPGGLRADMTGTGTGAFPRNLTYKQAAVVQPFANTLVNMDLTGAQIKATLEQQWQPGGASRPFLKLGISKGFTYTYDPGATQGNRITGMWLNGTPIVLGDTYSTTVNSFLATGGDNFTTLNGGTGKQDTGKTDLQAMVEYMDEFANTSEGDSPLPVDYKQNSVGIVFPVGAPASYPSATKVKFDVSSWSMTNPDDVKDTAVTVKLGATTLGTSTLDNAPQAALPGFDEVGKTTVDLKIPATFPTGVATLTLTGAQTGTERTFPITVAEGQEITADPVTITYGAQAALSATVAGNHGTPSGTVEFFEGPTSLGAAVPVVAGAAGTATATLTQAARALPAGAHTIRAEYSGGNTYPAGNVEFTLTVNKAATTVTADDASVVVGQDGTVHVAVTSGSGADVTGDVEVFDGATSLGSATLAGGAADVSVNSDSLTVGPHTLTAKYATTTNYLAGQDDLVLTVTKATPVVTVGTGTMTYGKSRVVTVVVAAAGQSPGGTVQIKNGATVLATGTVNAGTAFVTLPAKSLPPGSAVLAAVYSGDANVAGATQAFQQQVVKATSTVSVKVKPGTIKKNVTKARVKIVVSADGVVPTGKVKVKVKGEKAKTVTLINGKITVKFGPFGSLGKRKVTVKYLGDPFVNASSARTDFTVV